MKQDTKQWENGATPFTTYPSIELQLRNKSKPRESKSSIYSAITERRKEKLLANTAYQVYVNSVNLDSHLLIRKKPVLFFIVSPEPSGVAGNICFLNRNRLSLQKPKGAVSLSPI